MSTETVKPKKSRKVIALVLAGMCALVAGLAVVKYVSRADDRAVVGQEPVSVWVVTKDIPRGTTVADAKLSLRQDQVPTRSAPASAVTSLPGDTMLATSDIATGEILLTGRFAEEKLGPEALSVPAGHLAVSAELTDQERVASFVKPGDDVAVFFAPKDGGVAWVVLPRVQVLGTGMQSETGNVTTEKGAKDSQISTQVLTLSVTPAEAAKLIAGTTAESDNAGHVYFGLLPAKTKVGDNTAGTSLPKQFDNLLPKMLARVEASANATVAA